MKPIKLAIFTTIVATAAVSWGQEPSPADTDQLESIFKQDEVSEPRAMPTPSERSKAIENLSTVRRLEPYKDIAVIQRRFLPKTNRFELFGSGGLIMNDSFFNNVVLDGRVGYAFSEALGAELVFKSVSTSEKDVTKDLQSKKGVTTQSLVSPMSYIGGAVKWSPWYGKISLLNRSIVPFDQYFTIGGGSTTTNQGSTAPTLQVGTGQIFAISKRFAFRWDLSWMFYNTSSNVSGDTGTASYNNLYLALGLSWFFPEASYR